jgi:hypothetical protein
MKEKKSYFVTYKVDARCTVEVKAESLEEAKANAQAAYENADITNSLDFISSEPVIIEDEKGNYLWEK